MTPTDPPTLSILIATHNRRDLLRRCVDSLVAQTQAPSTFELVVVDDGSTDGTATMAAELDTPFRLRVLSLPNGGKAAALNAAIPVAAGSICLFLDDDVIASPQLVAEHVRAHRAEPMALALGSLTQVPPDNRDWYGHAYAQDWNQRFEALGNRQPNWTDCYGGNFSAPRAALEAVGGFSTELPAVEDIELGFRLHNAGCVPTYMPKAHVVHDDQKPRRRMIGHNLGFGAFCAEFGERHPATRRQLIGWFCDATPREVRLRRTVIALRVPPRLLAALGAAIPGEGRRLTWFGFVSRATFWAGARRAMTRARWRETARSVPVLMYHAFTATGEPERYLVTKSSFTLQMRLLAALRYRVISFEDFAQGLREGRMPARRTAVVTIDDGYLDNLEIALPILRRRRFPATLFLISRRLGAGNDWSPGHAIAGRPLASADQVARMRQLGAEIGGHTRTHCSLPSASDSVAREEVVGGREDLEAIVGAPVTTFAYPYGELDDRDVSIVDNGGYLGACTTLPRRAQLADDPLRIPRIEVMGTDSPRRFLQKLRLGGL